jgi:hypothetical protein
VEGIENALIPNLTTEVGTVSAADSTGSSRSSQLKHLILDCSFVTGADVNAVTGLLKMRDLIASKYNTTFSDTQGPSVEPAFAVQVRVIFAGLQSSLEAMFSVQEAALSMFLSSQIFAPAEGGIPSLSSPRLSPIGDDDSNVQSHNSDCRLTDYCEEVALTIYEGMAPTVCESVSTRAFGGLRLGGQE